VSTPKSLVAGGLMVLVTTMGMLCSKGSATRSVEPAKLADALASPKFSREKSTGLFVGVRDFPHDETLEVPYAVDDAIDLAYRFTLDQRVGLVPARRAILVISGSPQKEESKQRLNELKDAGVRIVRNAISDEILDLLKEQSARAGDDGIFVLSIASHGFQQHGDAYILGSTSSFGAPETSLRAATIFDVAAQAGRSLIFMDACRDRIGSRGATPDPAAAAPLIRRMKNVRGQVIFYAAAPGEYAYDDRVHRNGVFTKAVLDGLDGQASAPRGVVVVEALHRFVDRQVRNWILENKHRTVDPATQISMEGETRNMPLCECWRYPGPLIRVEVDRTIVTAYNKDTQMLWRKDLGAPVAAAIAADLDADSFYEVVVGFHDRIVALDRDGKPLWTRTGETKMLRAFVVGDLFEKHTSQVVALWNDDHSSRLTVVERDGSELSRRNYDGLLQRVAIGRPTNRHAPKIVAATNNGVMVFHVKKLDRAPEWSKVLRPAAAGEIENLRILDGNHDDRSDIEVTTASGTTWFTFDGKILRQSAKGTWENALRQTKRRG
jgi:hypothetical protein